MGMLGWLRRRGLEMKGLITMDDLTNEDILSILDDAIDCIVDGDASH